MTGSEFLIPGATIGAAVLTLIGVLVAQLRRKPAEVTDLWAENRKRTEEAEVLRAEIATLREDVGTKLAARDAKISRLGDGFDAAMTVNTRLVYAIETAGIPIPPISVALQDRIDAARAVRDGE